MRTISACFKILAAAVMAVSISLAQEEEAARSANNETAGISPSPEILPQETPSDTSPATPPETPQDALTEMPSPQEEEEWEPPLQDSAWQHLEKYQYTITRAVFEDKLNLLYDPQGALRDYIRIFDDKVEIYDRRVVEPGARRLFMLNFAQSPSQVKEIPRAYRTAQEFKAQRSQSSATKPLAGLRVAIDPGHIGGAWGPIEMRSVEFPGIGTVQEGDFNVITARLIRQQLQDYGATVFLTRETTEPVTKVRPQELHEQARKAIYERSPEVAARLQHLPIEEQDRQLGERLIRVANYIFARTAEKIARAEKLQKEFQADITLVLYINATPTSGRGELTTDNRNTFFVHGAYMPSELTHASQRLALFEKLLSRTNATEFFVASKIAEAFTELTQLPPVLYGDSPSTRQLDPENPYVIARNLAANREYPGPVVVPEPYFMNNRTVAQRLLAGDYEGEREIEGTKFRSIFREYAEGVVKGLLKAYGDVRIDARPSTP